MILILTGPTRSHKTTTLKRWAEKRNDCGGVLSPDVNGLRVLYNVKTKETIPWQKTMPDASDIIVGRFSFDPDAFTVASLWLDKHLEDPEVFHIILDEVGKLELDGKGWGPWLRTALPVLQDKTLVLVVRRLLLDNIINLYGMDEVSVVEKDYFS
jgi:nucleoside-triphosphatase THEP1